MKEAAKHISNANHQNHAQGKEGGHFFNNNIIQPKLTVGQKDDAYEKQADQTADNVVQKLNNNTAESAPAKVESAQEKEKLQRKEKPEKEKIQKLSSNNDSGTVAPASVESGIEKSKGGGSAMDGSTRNNMESAFGHNFSDVRIHTGTQASQMNDEVGAHAFTHGNDIYFNHGKYNPNSKEGSHLLAHELTHTVQQSGGLQRSIQRTNTPASGTSGSSSATTGTNIASVTPAALAAQTPHTHGKMEKIGNNIKITLLNFPLKQYDTAGLTVAGTGAGAEVEYTKPKPGTRRTHQSGTWRRQVKNAVKNSIEHFPGLTNIDPTTVLSFKLKRAPHTVIGTSDELSNEIVVPYWDRTGRPHQYDIEHKMDWQVVGNLRGENGVDNIRNLILLDRQTNQRIGQDVRQAIEMRINSILTHYRSILNLTHDTAVSSDNVIIVFKNPQKTERVPGNKISISPMEAGPEATLIFGDTVNAQEPRQSIFNTNTVELVRCGPLAQRDIGLKTSVAGAANILPYNYDGVYLKLTGTPQPNKSLTEVKFKKIVNDPNNTLQQNIGDGIVLPHQAVPNQQHIYRVQSQGYAGVIRDSLRVRQMSPIEITEASFSPTKGWSAEGRVVSDLSILQGADITFGIEDSNYYIQAAIPLTHFASKIPRPFEVTSCSIIIYASSSSRLSVSGNIEFKLGNLGTGIVSAGVNRTGVFLDGSFNFKNDWFDPAEIRVGYREGNWNIGGTIGIGDNKVKGVRRATLNVDYRDGVFTANGDADLKIPGVSNVTLASRVENSGNFMFSAEATLTQLPGIQGGRLSATITSEDDDLKVRAEGTVTPNLPGVPGLSASIHVLYDDGLFDANTTINYTRGRYSGTLTIGITNASVDEHGRPNTEASQDAGEEVFVYGFGEFRVNLIRGINGTARARLTPEGQVLVGAEITASNMNIFGNGYRFTRNLFSLPSLSVPLVGIPGLSISVFVNGSVDFMFDWQPLVLRELTVSFDETDINHLDQATINIHGNVGSLMNAELTMQINAGLEARVLVATLRGYLGGIAGIGIRAEAGGELDAYWDAEHGLMLREISAYVNVNPYGIFRLTGNISVDLDLWLTSINLYYHQWVLAERQLNINGMNLGVRFPIRFDNEQNPIMPDYSSMQLEKPDFNGDAAMNILDEAINGESRDAEERKKQELRIQIRNDLRRSTYDDSFSPSEYREEMSEKYEDNPEFQRFTQQTISEEVINLEYEKFEVFKNQIRALNVPLEDKLDRVDSRMIWWFSIDYNDVLSFKNELRQIDAERNQQQSNS
ncbi:MAG: DUF4157 domain-containing protein [Flavobacteriales bacterium]|nr:DUF4157 domain-containing protein [Flavobacteriales bacterium]